MAMPYELLVTLPMRLVVVLYPYHHAGRNQRKPQKDGCRYFQNVRK
tara:strand:- start:301 stop:438 length:138 start_codon:yes stop_codon:yes gene_type:complete